MGFFPAHVLKYFLFPKSDRHYNIRIDNNSIFCQILLPVFTLSHNKGTPARQDQLHQQHKIYIIQTLLRYQQSSTLEIHHNLHLSIVLMMSKLYLSTRLLFPAKHNRLLLFLFLLFSNRHYLLKMCFLSDNFTRCLT